MYRICWQAPGGTKQRGEDRLTREDALIWLAYFVREYPEMLFGLEETP